MGVLIGYGSPNPLIRSFLICSWPEWRAELTNQDKYLPSTSALVGWRPVLLMVAETILMAGFLLGYLIFIAT